MGTSGWLRTMNQDWEEIRSGQRRDGRGRESAELRELRQEIGELRRANRRHEPRPPRPAERRNLRYESNGPRRRRAGRSRRRRWLIAVLGLALLSLAVTLLMRAPEAPRSFRLPSRTSLARMTLERRVVAVAGSQVGYSTDPSDSYCNKFSAYWGAGTPSCAPGEAAEEWCADFAAWAWQRAGLAVNYGYGPGDLNAGAASFYEWGINHGTWHSVDSGYRAAPGDVAVYGLRLEPSPWAAHVAIVVDDPPGQRGPNVINGDGDRTGFSVVETGHDQFRADTGKHQGALLAGYVSP